MCFVMELCLWLVRVLVRVRAKVGEVTHEYNIITHSASHTRQRRQQRRSRQERNHQQQRQQRQQHKQHQRQQCS